MGMLGSQEVKRGSNLAEKQEEKSTPTASLRLVTPEAKDPLDEIKDGKPVRRHVKDTACAFALVLILIAGVSAWRGGTLAMSASLIITALVVLAIGYLATRLFVPVWRSWMAFAGALNIVVTFTILSIMWFLVFIPIGIALRLLGKAVMNIKFREQIVTYWEERKPDSSNFNLLERQY